VGRFTQKKGLDIVYEIAKARPGFRWVLIGRDDLDPRTWNLPNIQVLSPQPQTVLRQYYISADLFILPSMGEGFPLAIQESLSCGLPAAVPKEIADYVPDAPLIQIDTGSLPGMFQTVDNIFAHPEQLVPLRGESAKYAQRWDWANVADQYEKLFEQLTYSH
jgi:starch synthase